MAATALDTGTHQARERIASNTNYGLRFFVRPISAAGFPSINGGQGLTVRA